MIIFIKIFFIMKNFVIVKDVIVLFWVDYGMVSGLFVDYEKMNFSNKKKVFVVEICIELSVYVQIEEEIFYLVVKVVFKDKFLVLEVIVEYVSFKDLIVQIEGVEFDGEFYDVKVKVLFEYVKYYVKEEQNEMFLKVKVIFLDLVEFGVWMMVCKVDFFVV